MKGKVGFILAFCFWVYNPVFAAKRRILGLRRDIFKKGIILFGALLFLKNIEARKTRVLTYPFSYYTFTYAKVPTTKFVQHSTNGTGQKEKRVTKIFTSFRFKKSFIHWPWRFHVLVETQVYTGCQSFFTHVLLIIRTPPFDSRNILLHWPWRFRVLVNLVITRSA